MSSHVGVLAHYQPLTVRPQTHLASEVAALLVRRMIAERISQKLIRMLPPDSVFPLKSVLPQARYVPKNLPPIEGDGNVFVEPQDEAWVQAHQAAIRSVRIRAWMTYRALYRVSARSRQRNLAAPSRPTQPLAPARLLAGSL